MRIVTDRSQVVLVLVGVGLVGINIFLIVQNGKLKTSLESSKQVVTEEGYRFSDLTFRGLDGGEGKIDLTDGEKKTLLLVFNSMCQYCKQQYPHWKELVRNLDDSSWRVLAVSSETDREELKAHVELQGMQNITVGTVGADEMRRARMLFTPMTIAVDVNGEVKKVWAGLWTKGFDLEN